MSSHINISIGKVIVALVLASVLNSGMQASATTCYDSADWKNVYLIPPNADPTTNIAITLTAEKTEVQPGDEVSLTVETDRDCYLTVMDLGSSGRVIRLWPNRYSSQDNKVEARTPRAIPGPDDGFRIKVAGPAGVERLVVFASSEKGKILSEDEFRALKDTAFSEFLGSPKDLAVEFQEGIGTLDASDRWGTAQLNFCITPPDRVSAEAQTTVPLQPGSGPHATEPAPEQASGDTVATGTVSQGPDQSAAQPDPAPDSASREQPAATESPDADLHGKTYLFAVGVSTGRLKYCENDARKAMDLLRRKTGAQYRNIRTLLGNAATHDGMMSGLKWLARTTEPEDVVFIYFSGHGTSVPDQSPLDEDDDKDEAFVLFHEKKPADYQKALEQKILMLDDDFNGLLKQIMARRKIIIVDACHSGTIYKHAGLESEDFVSKYYPLADPASGEDMWMLTAKRMPTNYGNDHEAVLAACLDSQSSYEYRLKKSGLFTYHLLNAINAGQVSLHKAFEQAGRKTVELSTEAFRESRGRIQPQTPQLTDPHGLVSRWRFTK